MTPRSWHAGPPGGIMIRMRAICSASTEDPVQMLKSKSVIAASVLCASVCTFSMAQTPPAATGPAAKAAIANRRAIFTLIGTNFRPIAEILRGGAPSQSDLDKYTARVAFLAGMLPGAFPDGSSGGDTRAKADIWSSRADFNKLLQEFQDHSTQLAQAASRHDAAAVNTTVGAVAQDCKTCHNRYRSE